MGLEGIHGGDFLQTLWGSLHLYDICLMPHGIGILFLVQVGSVRLTCPFFFFLSTHFDLEMEGREARGLL